LGEKLRSLRQQKDVSQKEMAESLGISSAYLSALEHGRRGKPTWALLQQIIGYFNIIWDEAEELQKLSAISHPRVVIDTAGLDARTTLLANLMAENIQRIDKEDIEKLIAQIKSAIDDKDNC
jgi:transcriptional regulator with XRE-family HTH domain